MAVIKIVNPSYQVAFIREFLEGGEFMESSSQERIVAQGKVEGARFKLIYEFSTGNIIIWTPDEDMKLILSKLIKHEKFLRNSIIIGFSHKLGAEGDGYILIRKNRGTVKFIRVGEEAWVARGEDGCYFSATIKGLREILAEM
ncbi:hypothetical protein [Pyrococcus kukulkanii]|uniref:Uncharacterized protein n=1 Tax=Pyrococcus kukulkanii TaxID=1609559 RepID=A0A127B9B1_9EURY|nr:hypothetical protein [Pyrococcus kukulkanii]AMM53216.1 hypothetical protein TQ32_00925 [Pyrococcus kukulkanii]